MVKNNTLAAFRKRLITRNPSAFLLATQLVLMVLYAVFDKHPSGHIVISAFGLVVLLMVLWVVTSKSRVHWIAWIIALPAFAMAIISSIYKTQQLQAWSSLLESVLYIYTAVSLIFYMMADKNVTTDELFAVGATFTLLAWGFAHAFMVCLVWSPGSIINTTAPGHQPTFLELLFLSFTNLSATGLGDIMAVSAPTRVLAMIEQFLGVGYVAMVVSRLIGLTNYTRKKA
ncbi:MAG: two pore domain potassium channel family protein [Anaerolineaceae bacterium]|nr:two pore domain potassium channel family protein [Anaerolineaceae bacterium]